MKKQASDIRKRMVVIRLSAQEHEALCALVRETTERHVSTYLRKVILRKPVVVKYRNASADEFLRDMLQLQKQLRTISIDFSEAVQKLSTLQQIPEFRTWLLLYTTSKETVEQMITEINHRITQLYEQWLQK